MLTGPLPDTLDTHHDDPLVALTRAVGRLGEVELVGRLGDDILELDRLRAQLDAQISRRLDRFDAGLEHTVLGHRSAASWLTTAGRVAAGEAHARVRVARQCRALDPTRTAWEAGEISTRHVEAIARARHAARADDEFSAFEPAVVDVAKTHGPEAVVGVCGRWREALDADRQPDPAHNDNERKHERRGLNASSTLGDILVLDGILDPDSGLIVTTALDLALDDERVLDDTRTLPQLRADALTTICEQYLSQRQPGSNRPHLIIQTDLDTLTGRAFGLSTTESGIQLSADTIRMMACDAIIQHVLTDKNIPIDVGRQFRTFTPAQHRAMGIRDGGCRYPDCDKPPARCQGHHIDHWANHGPTDLANGVLLCRYHHRLMHHGRHQIRHATDDTDAFALDFYNPDGRHIGRTRTRAPTTPQYSRTQTQINNEIELIRRRVADLVATRAA